MPELRVLWPRLPLRTRGCLRFQQRIDKVAVRLVNHGHPGAAERLWRTCRML